MSSKRISPTSTILRSSRLFSLPPTLPRSNADTTSTSILYSSQNKISDTATLPYPIQQAITTPASSQARGDWGLKRSLPLRSTTRSSTPALRVNAIDTREHITDFESAGDLTVALRRFHDLGLPITTQPPGFDTIWREAPRSVFESDLDNTDPDILRKTSANRPKIQRWRYKGPWLAGLSQGEFVKYVETELRGRKEEFLAFVKARIEQKLAAERRERATAEGRRGEANQPQDQLTSAASLTTQQFATQLNRLRQNFDLQSPLAAYLAEFLDLPITATSDAHFADTVSSMHSRGPPPTHPSAGLTYLKSDAVLRNHPILGPLARNAPQQARVLSESRDTAAASRKGRLGVSGLVTPDVEPNKTNTERVRVGPSSSAKLQTAQQEEDPDAVASTIPGLSPEGYSQLASRDSSNQRSTSIGLTVPGGNKIWVEPSRAHVDSQGNVQLSVHTALRRDIAGHHFNGTDPLAPDASSIGVPEGRMRGVPPGPKRPKFASSRNEQRRGSGPHRFLPATQLLGSNAEAQVSNEMQSSLSREESRDSRSKEGSFSSDDRREGRGRGSGYGMGPRIRLKQDFYDDQ